MFLAPHQRSESIHPPLLLVALLATVAWSTFVQLLSGSWIRRPCIWICTNPESQGVGVLILRLSKRHIVLMEGLVKNTKFIVRLFLFVFRLPALQEAMFSGQLQSRKLDPLSKQLLTALIKPQTPQMWNILLWLLHQLVILNYRLDTFMEYNHSFHSFDNLPWNLCACWRQCVKIWLFNEHVTK